MCRHWRPAHLKSYRYILLLFPIATIEALCIFNVSYVLNILVVELVHKQRIS